MKKVCAIVGAGPGMGMAIAKRFAREGFDPALIARSADRLANYTADLQDAGDVAHGYPADAADPVSLVSAFADIAEEMDSPEVLVYNASAIHPQFPSKLEVDTLVEELRVNVAGALVAAQQVIPAMRERGSGTILFTGGGLALNPVPRYASLALGKAGLRSLAFSLHEELKGAGIHVATVTIAGFVEAGTHFDPDKIADVYWELHTQAPDAWEREIVYN